MNNRISNEQSAKIKGNSKYYSDNKFITNFQNTEINIPHNL